MTVLARLHATRAVPAGPVAFRHVLLSPERQWRCNWLGRGLGTVVAHTELVGSVVSYDVRLDGAERALLAQLSQVRPHLAVVS